MPLVEEAVRMARYRGHYAGHVYAAAIRVLGDRELAEEVVNGSLNCDKTAAKL